MSQKGTPPLKRENQPTKLRAVLTVSGGQAYLGERYCITVLPCPDIIWGNGVSSKIYLGERRSPCSLSTTPIGVDLAGLLGGRMASPEGGSVPSEWGMGKGVPSPADYRGSGSENGFWRILKLIFVTI